MPRTDNATCKVRELLPIAVLQLRVMVNNILPNKSFTRTALHHTGLHSIQKLCNQPQNCETSQPDFIIHQGDTLTERIQFRIHFRKYPVSTPPCSVDRDDVSFVNPSLRDSQSFGRNHLSFILGRIPTNFLSRGATAQTKLSCQRLF
jgi:hypothetical protein